MKIIFIADDRERKQADISDTLERLYPKAKIVDSMCAKDIIHDMLVSYGKEIHESPDECLAIVDMQMPRSPGQMIDINCGYFVLSSMQAHELEILAIIVSSERIDDERAKNSYEHFAGSILYHSYSDQAELYKKTLEHYFEEKKHAEDY